jgi:hypothetical protein
VEPEKYIVNCITNIYRSNMQYLRELALNSCDLQGITVRSPFG